jgi:hypothetical protein
MYLTGHLASTCPCQQCEDTRADYAWEARAEREAEAAYDVDCPDE